MAQFIPRRFDVIGYLAALLTTFSFVPQLLQTWRTRKAGDVAWGMLIAFNAGVVLWLVYGMHLHSQPMVLANGATLVFTLAILILKFHYR
ncbi:MAG TPA: SemiSWEET transporter [Terriglobales bacterium]